MLKYLSFFILATVVSCSSSSKKDGTTAGKSGENLEKRAEDLVRGKESKSGASGKSASSKGSSQKETVCTGWELRRKISLSEDAGQGCKVVYERGDVSKVVANARNQLSYCDEIYNRIKSTLEENGFTCHSK